ncbi:MAG: hypothetical protein MJB57_05910 [Gemmatimonadetes bacterium]|nr:hypothetical protein [Gemmatimonadota bacterium]
MSTTRGGPIGEAASRPSAWARRALIAAFWFLVDRSPGYRGPVRAALRAARVESLALRSSLVRRLLLTKDEPRYRSILHTRPRELSARDGPELHMLTSEADLLRALWALKSFFHFSKLAPRLCIHSDGSLRDTSIEALRAHFPGCRVATGEEVPGALSEYPMCRFFRRRHVLARKILDVLLVARSEYLLVMDTDVLWFGESDQIRACVRSRMPFHMRAVHDAYARNSAFLRRYCGLDPAPQVNTGMIGFDHAESFDLDFLENALDRIVNVPRELIPESIGFPVPDAVKEGRYDPIDSVSWWVLEQTLYALLFGRCSRTVQLEVESGRGTKAHPFVNRRIEDDTALQHYIMDNRWNAQFPVGVEHLLRAGFLSDWASGAAREHESLREGDRGSDLVSPSRR